MNAFGKMLGGGRRRADRNPAPLTAIFTTVAHSRAACLIDLSCTGASLRGKALPEKGEELMLSVGRLRAFATVVWAEPEQCGVRFDVPLGQSDVMTVRCQAASQGSLPPELTGALEDWTSGFAR
jgi:PilZ domain-containing protein